MSAALIKELRERTGLGLLECKKALAAASGDVEKAIEEMRKSSGMKAAKKAGRTAADGVVVARVADDGSFGVIVEVNSETDFVARDENFLGFVNSVVDAAFANKQTDVATLMAGDLEASREALVQKIGENISVRRIELVNADSGVVGFYVHGNSRIAVLVELKAGDQDLAKDIAMHVAAVNPQVVAPKDMPAEVIAKETEIYTAQAQESGKPAEIIEKMIGGRIKKFLAENSLTEQSFVKDPDVTVGKLASAAGAEVVSFTRFEVGEGIAVAKVDFAEEVAAQLNG
jgi:elongation factor Ts